MGWVATSWLNGRVYVSVSGLSTGILQPVRVLGIAEAGMEMLVSVVTLKVVDR